MKGSREQVLTRIAEALSARVPSSHRNVVEQGQDEGSRPFRAWLPPVSGNPDERLALFARQAQVLSTNFRQCANEAEAAAIVAGLVEENGWKTIASHRGSLVESIVKRLPPTVAVFGLSAGYEKDALESCDASLTECECLVAQTGSVCVTARSSGGRALSVLPPHHIVIARHGQLVSDLSEAIERLSSTYSGTLPSFISFISGPSRTGDIERILVLGAHGPRKLTILLLP